MDNMYNVTCHFLIKYIILLAFGRLLLYKRNKSLQDMLGHGQSLIIFQKLE